MKIFYVSIFLCVAKLSSQHSIVTNSRVCSHLGKVLINEGGNIVDSAIGIMLCEGLVSPQDSGIGGGFTGTVFINKVPYMIDARETAPKNLLFSDLTSKNKKNNIGIPGALKGYELISNKWGKMKLKSIFLFMSRLCKKGFDANDNLKSILPYYPEFDFLIKKDKVVKRNKVIKRGKVINRDKITEVDKVINSKLCTTLEDISKYGVDYFYNNISTEIIKDIKGYNNKIVKDDFVNYKAHIKKPSHVKIDPYTEIYSTSYPGIGEVLLNEMKVLLEKKNNYDIVEGSKKLYKSIPEYRYEKFYKKSLKKLINPKRNIHGTTNICIQDDHDNGLCFTSTINHYFGSEIISNSTGVILNNQLLDFPYYYGLGKIANKRPPSYASATIMLKNGKPILLLGATGGSRIPSGILNVMNYLFNEKLSFDNAIKMMRIYSDPGITEVEKCTYNKDQCKSLTNILSRNLKGHKNDKKLQYEFSPYNTVTGIYNKKPVCDPRRGGLGIEFK